MPPRDGQDMAPLRRATIHDRRTFDSYMGHRHRSETAGLGGFPSAAKRLVERCKLAEPRRARLKMEPVGRAERELCLQQPRQILFAGDIAPSHQFDRLKIGRASCRERECKYG